MQAPTPPAYAGNHVMVAVDMQAFVSTRNALTIALTSLSSSIDRAVKAYSDHTEVVLAGNAPLDLSSLVQPFNQLNQFVQQFPPAYLNQYGAPNEPAAPVAPMSTGSVKQPKQKRAYKPRDMNAPKRPLTAYFRYLREQRPLITQEFAQDPAADSHTAGDIAKIATERWKALSLPEQWPYKAAYQNELLKYETDTKAYKDSLKADGLKPATDDAEGEEEEEESEDDTPMPLAVAKALERQEKAKAQKKAEAEREEMARQEEEAPAPPPKKKAKSVEPKKITAGPDPAPPQQPQMFGSLKPGGVSAAPVESAKKRKATADGEEGSTPKKKPRRSLSDKEKAAAEKVQSWEEPTPNVEKSAKKQKKRKGDVAA